MNKNSRKSNHYSGKGKKGISNKGKPQFTERQRDVESMDMRETVPATDNRTKKYNAHDSRANDPRWYALNDKLMHDYASFPFADPIGTLFKTGFAGYDSYSVPGLTSIEFVPSIGWADSEVAPINVAMRRVYSFVRHANSGAKNYDAPDLMLYLLAVDSAYMYLSYMKRIYGVMLDYSPFNRYYPRVLIMANKVNFDSIESNLNDFRGYINQFATKLSQLWIPNSMSYMARHAWMCEGMYVDSMSPKAQTYMYVPVSFYQFTLDAQGAGSLVSSFPALVGSPALANYENLVAYGNQLLNPLIGNEDFGIMGGDILKAFGESGIVKPQGITPEYQVLPLYSEEVLSQIENSTAYGSVANNVVTQTTDVGTGYLVSNPTLMQNFILSDGFTFDTTALSTLQNLYNSRRVLNMHHDSVTPAEVMVATRLTSMPEVTTSVVEGPKLQIKGNFKTCASEIVTRYKVWFATNETPTKTWEFTYAPMYTHIFIDLNFYGTHAQANEYLRYSMPMFSQFDWHPLFDYVTAFSTDGNTLQLVSPTIPMGDIDYYTVIDRTNIDNMNIAALLSEFSVPEIG